MTIVRHEDIRELDYCNPGARAFFAQHGLDWSSFIRHGIESSVLLETGDEMAVRAIAQAERRERGGT